MQQARGRMTLVRERFQWGSYGFIPGLILGIVLGWLFHGVVSWIFRFGLVALLLVPLVIAFVVWRRWSDRSRRDDVIESRYVVETRVDERGER